MLYSYPADYPLVEGHNYTSRFQTSGLRQGSPLFPLPFVLYLNVLLFALSAHAPPPPPGSTHTSQAFTDALFFRSTCPPHIQSILGFFDTVGRQWELDMNLDKTEVHAMGDARQRDFSTSTGPPLSTLNKHTGLPHTVYKYLRVYIYTKNQQTHTQDLIAREIRNFFAVLQTLSPTLSEPIRLASVQLIPALRYRLMADPIPLSQLKRLQSQIWAHLRHPGKFSWFTAKLSRKDNYTPRKKGGLPSSDFYYAVLEDTVNSAIRYLNGDGPPDICQAVRDLLMTPQRFPLQDTVLDAVQGLGLPSNSLGRWSPALPHKLQVHEPVWANTTGNGANECDMYLGRVDDTSATSAEVAFPAQQATEHFRLRDSQDPEFVLQPPSARSDQNFSALLNWLFPGSCSYPLFSAHQLPTPPHTPYGGTLLSFSPDACVYEPNVSPHSLRASHLQAWECHCTHQLPRQESQQTVWVYLDGSASRGGYGSAATVYLPNGTTFVFCPTSPFQTCGELSFGQPSWPFVGTRKPFPAPEYTSSETFNRCLPFCAPTPRHHRSRRPPLMLPGPGHSRTSYSPCPETSRSLQHGSRVMPVFRAMK